MRQCTESVPIGTGAALEYLWESFLPSHLDATEEAQTQKLGQVRAGGEPGLCSHRSLLSGSCVLPAALSVCIAPPSGASGGSETNCICAYQMETLGG